MFKFVVLFSVVAMAAANPSALVPLAHSAVVPGVTTVSAYDTSIVHPSPVYTKTIVHAAPLVHSAGLWNAGYHGLHKRSIAVAPALSYGSVISAAPYYNSWGSGYGLGSGYGYGSRYGASWLASPHGVGYSTAIAHPY